MYYYANSGRFHCFSNGCENPSFDVFELVIKLMQAHKHITLDLNGAVRWVAQRFGILGKESILESNDDKDWEVFKEYNRIQSISFQINKIVLKEYDKAILNRFNYDLKISPWIEEGIDREVMRKAQIGYYPGKEQITIPHFDIDNRFIGLRGRALSQEECDLFGKYKPLKINNLQYSHPLGMNLYGLNWTKDNIQKMKTAIIAESEKSVLQFASKFGWENNLVVACCGSNVSAYQIQLLKNLNVNEMVIAFDRQFQQIGDEEFKQWKKKLISIKTKYQNDILISIIWDKSNYLKYKQSPFDVDKETFLKLYNERIL